MKYKILLGILIILIGIVISLIPYVGWIYSPILIILGILIIIWRKQEYEIEQRKDIPKDLNKTKS